MDIVMSYLVYVSNLNHILATADELQDEMHDLRIHMYTRIYIVVIIHEFPGRMQFFE